MESNSVFQTRKVVFDATTLSMNCKQVVFVDQNSCIKDEIERKRSSKSQVNPEVSSGYSESFRKVTGLLSYKPDSRVVNGLSRFFVNHKNDLRRSLRKAVSSPPKGQRVGEGEGIGYT